MPPNPETEKMPPAAEGLLALFRRVEAWIEGDLLLVEPGTALLAEIAAACQVEEARELASVRRHTARFLRSGPRVRFS